MPLIDGLAEAVDLNILRNAFDDGRFNQLGVDARLLILLVLVDGVDEERPDVQQQVNQHVYHWTQGTCHQLVPQPAVSAICRLSGTLHLL